MGAFDDLLPDPGVAGPRVGTGLPAGGFADLVPEDNRPAYLKAIQAVQKLVGGSADTLMHGITQGYSDELAGLVGSVLPGGKGGDALRDEQRQSVKDFQTDHPIAGTAIEVAGGAMPLLPAFQAAKAIPLAGRLPGWARLAAGGAATGAVNGFGTGEGGFENRAESAATGGLMGGLMGLAAPLALRGGAKLASPVVNRFFREPGDVAADKVLQAFRRDDITPNDVLARLDELGPHAALVDAGGENLSGLGRAAAGVPGKAKQRAATFLNERQEGQVPRVAGAAKDAMGDVGDYYSTVDDLMTRRAAEAKPLYEKAYAAPVNWGDDFNGLMERPSMKSALARAHKIAAEEGRDPKALGFDLNEAGDVVFNKVPSMQTLDYVKRGLDDVLEGFRDKTSGRLVLNEAGRAINNTRASFLSALDEANPDYKAARAAWGGPTQSKDALEMGRDFLRSDAEITTKQLDRLADGDKAFFRAGAYRAIKDQIENTPDAADAVKRIFGSEAKRAKLRAVFPDDAAFGKFEKAMNAEAEFFKNRFKVLGGSQTAQRGAEMEDLPAGDVVGAGMDVMTGNVPGLVRRGANWAVDRMRVPTERIADPLSGMLFAPGQEARQNIARLLARPLPKPIYGGKAGIVAALAAQESGRLAGGP
jgi:hypothetical protein